MSKIVVLKNVQTLFLDARTVFRIIPYCVPYYTVRSSASLLWLKTHLVRAIVRP